MRLEVAQSARPAGAFTDYIAIARPDHWLKNVFMLPGAALAVIVDNTAWSLWLLPIGIISTCLIASANYTINEFLDGKFDRFHPTKSNRPAAQGRLLLHFVLLQYLILCAAGLFLASFLNPVFLYASVGLLVMGILYNVNPFRTKDRVYLDVLSESINNPLRLILGWAAVTTLILPPSSLLIAYWMGGAYLMAVKRYAEFRLIADPELAGRYRRSFTSYTETSLLLSGFFYALTSVFFLGIFLIKYKIEFLISFPFFALLFVWYQHIALRPKSAAMNPEKLYLEPKLLLYVGFLVILVTVLFVVDIPAMKYLTEHTVMRDIRVP